jgi:acyl carrier protein
MKVSQNVEVSQFVNEIADIIEADPQTLSLESDFRESADFWSSLVGFALLTFLEDQYGRALSIDEFLESKTIGDLYAKAQVDKGDR